MGIDPSGSQRRSEPRPESPWLVDQRRTPRSVRTPSPYSSSSFRAGPRRRQRPNRSTNPFDSPSVASTRRRPSNNNNKSTNPFDSPALSSRNPATPASRNPSPSDDYRMVYTSQQGGRRTNPHGSNTPSPGQPPRFGSTNPFESPAVPVRNKNRTNPFESPSPYPQRSKTNPFESPASSRYNNRRASNNPFDPSVSTGASSGNSRTPNSPHYPEVKVTVHTQQQQQQQHRPVTPQKSVGLDSLEQILDTTEETVEEDTSEEVIEETGRKDGWVDEPQQEEREVFRPILCIFPTAIYDFCNWSTCHGVWG